MIPNMNTDSAEVPILIHSHENVHKIKSDPK